MPFQDGEWPDSLRITSEDLALLHDLGDISGDIMGCFNAMVNDPDADATQVREVMVDDKLLGATLTTITLPDGTQAFAGNSLDGNESEYKEPTVQLENAEAILINELSEFLDGKTLQFELEPLTFPQTEADTSQSMENNTIVQLMDGTTYMVIGHTDIPDGDPGEILDGDLGEIEDGHLGEIQDGDLGEIQDGKLEKDKPRRQYPCPYEGCTKVYISRRYLKVHKRFHTGQRPYKCTHPKCKKTFLARYSLNAHSRTHTGEKPYKCTAESCDKSFKTSGDLGKHVRTHTGERPFVCPIEGCGRSFATSNVRKVHVRTHTGERPYKCDQCGKGFTNTTNYKNHIRIHSGEKPYACPAENCNRRFTESSSMRKHQLVHAQEQPFECKLCPMRFRQSSTLVTHKRTAHALIESDDEMDTLSEPLDISDDPAASRKSLPRRNITVSEDGQVQITEATKDSTDTETQILLVDDPSQTTDLQVHSLHSGEILLPEGADLQVHSLHSGEILLPEGADLQVHSLHSGEILLPEGVELQVHTLHSGEIFLPAGADLQVHSLHSGEILLPEGVPLLLNDPCST